MLILQIRNLSFVKKILYDLNGMGFYRSQMEIHRIFYDEKMVSFGRFVSDRPGT